MLTESLTPTATPAQAPTISDLALELGRVRYERDLLLHQIQVLEADIAAARGPTAWRTLLSVARFVEERGAAATNGGHDGQR